MEAGRLDRCGDLRPSYGARCDHRFVVARAPQAASTRTLKSSDTDFCRHPAAGDRYSTTFRHLYASGTSTCDGGSSATGGSSPKSREFFGLRTRQFAMNVRSSYLSQGGPEVTAYSPVTGQSYDMVCAVGYTAHLSTGRTVDAVRCVGGNDAVVILW